MTVDRPTPDRPDDSGGAAARGLLGRLGAYRLREAEETLTDRVRALDAHASELARATIELERRETRALELADELERRLRSESAELDAREAALDAYTTELAARQADLHRREAELEERRRELGAVELRRASVERREDAVAERERALAARSRPAVAADAHLLFVPGARYALLEQEGPAPPLGATVRLGAGVYVVARVSGSPYPHDGRRCAYLEGSWDRGDTLLRDP